MNALPLWPVIQVPENPSLTPYMLPGDQVRAAVVVCPGGGYGGRAAHEGAPIARWLNSLGLHAFVCDYRVAPNRHPAPSDDAQRALRMVRYHAKEWNIHPQKVGLLGFSAGGHLVCSVGNFGTPGDPTANDPVARESGQANAVIACYPVISLGEFAHQGSFDNLLGKNPEVMLREKLSLETTVTENNPPTFIWFTADDAAVPVENGLLYAMALRRHRVPFALHVYPHGNHGLGLAAEQGPVSAWTSACAEWLSGIGFR